ncbi:MAG: hypothetical protein H6849_04615 [Alphaproteobacteria bacterium]|nr:MAG: hypothetical protein H6849_04615 [Alphaproteobacteria bacterium]
MKTNLFYIGLFLLYLVSFIDASAERLLTPESDKTSGAFSGDSSHRRHLPFDRLQQHARGITPEDMMRRGMPVPVMLAMITHEEKERKMIHENTEKSRKEAQVASLGPSLDKSLLRSFPDGLPIEVTTAGRQLFAPGSSLNVLACPLTPAQAVIMDAINLLNTRTRFKKPGDDVVAPPGWVVDYAGGGLALYNCRLPISEALDQFCTYAHKGSLRLECLTVAKYVQLSVLRVLMRREAFDRDASFYEGITLPKRTPEGLVRQGYYKPWANLGNHIGTISDIVLYESLAIKKIRYDLGAKPYCIGDIVTFHGPKEYMRRHPSGSMSMINVVYVGKSLGKDDLFIYYDPAHADPMKTSTKMEIQIDLLEAFLSPPNTFESKAIRAKPWFDFFQKEADSAAKIICAWRRRVQGSSVEYGDMLDRVCPIVAIQRIAQSRFNFQKNPLEAVSIRHRESLRNMRAIYKEKKPRLSADVRKAYKKQFAQMEKRIAPEKANKPSFLNHSRV